MMTPEPPLPDVRKVLAGDTGVPPPLPEFTVAFG
jgi:hypothetical protein